MRGKKEMIYKKKGIVDNLTLYSEKNNGILFLIWVTISRPHL